MVQLGRTDATCFDSTRNLSASRHIGTPGPGPTNNIPIHEAVCYTKTYYGVSEGDSNPPEYIPKLVQMYKDGKFPIDKISKVYSYKQMDEAIHAMHDGSVSPQLKNSCPDPAHV